MKIRTPDWLNKLGSVFEDAADDIEEVAFELRDSFAVEAIRAGIVIALTGIKKCPVIPSGFIVGLPGGVEMAVMGIRPRIELLIEYANTPPSTRKEILDFFFIFAPSYIKVVPELEVSVFGVNATLGKGGVIIEGDDVHEALHNLIEDKKD